MRTGDITGARALLASVVGSGRDLAGSVWFALALFWSGIAAMRAGDYGAAVGHYEEVLPMFRRLSQKTYTQWVLDHLSQANLELGEFAASRAYAEEGVRLMVESGAQGNIVHLYSRLGSLERLRDDHRQAAGYFEQALALVPAHDPHDRYALTANLAGELAQCGDLEVARRHAHTAIEGTQGLAPARLPTGGLYPPPVAHCVNAVLQLALAAGYVEEAAELAGAVSGLLAHDRAPSTAARLAALRRRIAEAVDDEGRLTAATARGRALEDPLLRASEILESLPTPERPAPSPG